MDRPLCELRWPPHPGENPDDEWRAESDGTGELLVFWPECWQREFGAGSRKARRVAGLPIRFGCVKRGTWQPF